MSESPRSPGPQTSSRGLHLDSWKEIAGYLKRDIRTVQRWEKQEGLPVYRHQHDERGTAYAYSGEIDRWLQARSWRTLEGTRETVPADHAAHREGSADAGAAAHVVLREAPRPRRRFLLLVGSLLALTLAAAAATWWRTRVSTAPRPVSTLSLVFPLSDRFPDWGPDLALSPDGTTLLYTTRGRLHLRRLDQLESQSLPGSEDAWGPFFSPDGRWIGFFAPGRLVKLSTSGGAPVVVTDMEVDFIGGADWGRDDVIVFAAPTRDGGHGLFRVPASGGPPQPIAALPRSAETSYWLTPQWLRHGDVILATVARSTAEATRFQGVLVSVATGETRVLLEDARHVRHVGDFLVYWRQGGLFAVRFDDRRLELVGPHVAAWENVGVRVRNRSWTLGGHSLVYWPNVRTARELVWVDRHGREESLPLPPDRYQSPRLSPDGRAIAVIVESVSSEFGDVWRFDIGTGALARITHGGRGGAIAWTPDGTHLVVSMREGGSNDLYRVRSDGTGDPEKLPDASDLLKGAFKQPVGWTADGRLILAQTGLPQQPSFWTVALDSGRLRPLVDDRRAWAGSVSSDGRWLAYTSPESGRSEVYVVPVPDGRPKWRVSVNGGARPLWARGGRELFYRNGTRLMAVSVTAKGVFLPAEPRQLYERDYYEVQPGEPHYDVSPDAERFVLVQRGRPDGPERLNVIQGWRAEIERRLAVAR